MKNFIIRYGCIVVLWSLSIGAMMAHKEWQAGFCFGMFLILCFREMGLFDNKKDNMENREGPS
jgi:hypothetical protein